MKKILLFFLVTSIINSVNNTFCMKKPRPKRAQRSTSLKTGLKKSSYNLKRRNNLKRRKSSCNLRSTEKSAKIKELEKIYDPNSKRKKRTLKKNKKSPKITITVPTIVKNQTPIPEKELTPIIIKKTFLQRLKDKTKENLGLCVLSFLFCSAVLGGSAIGLTTVLLTSSAP